jgi:AcrR family transcriptional regulator
VTGHPVGPGRTGRRPGESGTRLAIMRAARARFAERGFDGATIRGIAADAGVDPALVHHFYGDKERLFVAAMGLPAVPSEILARLPKQRRAIGEAIVRAVLQVWESEETRAPALALLRSAFTNERAAAMLREFVTSTILGNLAAFARDEDAEYRAALVGSQLVGLGIARYVIGLEPVASASVDDIAAAIGPTVRRYLTGTIDRPSRATGTG